MSRGRVSIGVSQTRPPSYVRSDRLSVKEIAAIRPTLLSRPL